MTNWLARGNTLRRKRSERSAKFPCEPCSSIRRAARKFVPTSSIVCFPPRPRPTVRPNMPILPQPPSPDTPRRILGIDPGLQVTGYAVLEVARSGPGVCEAGVIRSAEKREPADMARRVKALYDGACEVLDQWKPAAVAIEQLYAHYDHPRTAILM